MAHPNQRQVLQQLTRLENFLNDWQMIPSSRFPRNRVFLALLSKALTEGRAVCALVRAGFPAEAFGLSRTLIDIFFSVRYMTNKDTETRVSTYVDYLARVAKEWRNLSQKYYPQQLLELSASDVEMMKVAEQFPKRHQWTAHGGGARFMALEPDTFEVNEQGQPVSGEFDYDALYFWTSQYVHVTMHALKAHTVEQERTFRVRAHISEEKDLGRLALFNTVSYLAKIFIQACRGMREEQPEAILRTMFKMMAKFKRQ
jgi:Family of unknown function (DUF5677)